MTNNTRIVLLHVWMQMVHSAMYADIARHLVKTADLSPRLRSALCTRNAGRSTGVSARALIGSVRFRSVVAQAARTFHRHVLVCPHDIRQERAWLCSSVTARVRQN